MRIRLHTEHAGRSVLLCVYLLHIRNQFLAPSGSVTAQDRAPSGVVLTGKDRERTQSRLSKNARRPRSRNDTHGGVVTPQTTAVLKRIRGLRRRWPVLIVEIERHAKGTRFSDKRGDGHVIDIHKVKVSQSGEAVERFRSCTACRLWFRPESECSRVCFCESRVCEHGRASTGVPVCECQRMRV